MLEEERREGGREGRKEEGREGGREGGRAGGDLLVGSSRKMTAGSTTNSIPIEQRLRSPPETP